MQKRKKAGFTLVELVVVIAVLAILAGIGAVAYNGYIEYARKAADEELIAAVNTAFAVACEENGVDRMGLPTGGARLAGTEGKITGISSVKELQEEALEAFKTSFNGYFEGNTDTKLQYYNLDGIVFDKETHMFTTDKKAVNTVKLLDSINENSNYAGHAKETATGLKILDELFSNFIENKHGNYDQSVSGNLKYVLDTFTGRNVSANEVKEFMDKLGVTDDTKAEEVSMAMVKYIAKETGKLDADETIAKLKEGGAAAENLNDFVRYPAMFGWTMGYRNSEYASEEFKTKFDGMLQKAKDGQIGMKTFMTFAMETVATDPNMLTYMAANDGEDFNADLKAYFAAMTLIDQNQDRAKAGMTVEEMTELIESIMGGY